jgi:DNA-binding response OmpR family regulator
MLTARTPEDDLVKGFDAGADDYLKKPYRLRELLARVRALSRRGGAAAPTSRVQVGTFTVDTEARTVSGADGRALEMTRTELDLLLFFVNNAARALTRDQILDAVWGKGIVVDERTVDNFVASLKRKLGLRADAAPRIVTVRGVGYRFEDA